MEKQTIKDPYGWKSKMRRSENKITKVFICIRLKPKSDDRREAKKEFEENLKRARIVARYAVLNGYNPEATTIYFTQFLDDFSPTERNLGIKIGQERLLNCNELWCVLDFREMPSSGMANDMVFAEINDIPIVHKDFSEISNWVKNYDKTSQ